MPVKKSKKTNKMKKQINRTVKKNIKKAVDQIPQMIVKEKEQKTTQQADLKITYQHNMKEYRGKQIIMWLGVAILSGSVFFMWFLNTNATFIDINKSMSKSEEVKLLNESSQKIKKILSDVDIQKKLESLKIEDVKVNPPVTSTEQFEALIKSINEMASSTQNITSSSTNIFTSSTTDTASSTINQ